MALDWRSNIIRPNVGQDGFIAERYGLHGDLSFNYLPPIPNATEDIQGRVESLHNVGRHREAADEIAKFISDYLQSWSEKDAPVLDNVMRLRPQLLIRLFKVIIGASASDPEPGATSKAAKTGDALTGKS